MNYLIDSDVMIDYLNGQEPGFSCLSGLGNESLKMCVVNWWEVMYGIRKYKAKKKQEKFQELLKIAEVEVISIDQILADKFIDLKLELETRGQRLTDFDLLIAGTAIVYDLILVTRNVRHFDRVKGLKIYHQDK